MNKTAVILITGTVAAMMSLVSCNEDPNHPGLEYMPDMYRSPAYEVYSKNNLFSDSLAMRAPAHGSVPRNFEFFDYPGTNEGYEAASRDVKNPLPRTPENVAEGQRLYNIYCTHCHGAKGQGDGSIVAIGKYPPPPSYSKGNSSRGGAMKDLTDGKIFHTITYGLNLMGPHASLVNPHERWLITMFVRDLQNEGNAAAATTDTAKTTADSSAATASAK